MHNRSSAPLVAQSPRSGTVASRAFERLLDIRHIRLVSALGRELNLSRCAELLHTTQPAVSRSLAQLEDLLGVRLFERSTRRITPTPAGLILIRHADRVLVELEAAESEIRYMPRGISGELRIGILPSFSSHIAAAALYRTRDLLPDIRLITHAAPLASLYEDLLHGRLHAMLAHAELNIDPDAIQVAPIYTERVCVVCSNTHPLAGKHGVSWDELAQYAWVLPPPDSPYRSKLNQLLSVHRKTEPGRKADVQANSLDIALAFASQGEMLWALAQQNAQRLIEAGEVARISLPEELLAGPMCCMWSRTDAPSASMRLFIQALQVAAEHLD